jgi:hypothetical protein
VDDSVKVVDFARFKADKQLNEYNWEDTPMNYYRVTTEGELVPFGPALPLSPDVVFKSLKGYKKEGFFARLIKRIFG